MPLKGGSSRSAIKANIKRLRQEGKGQAQALAIALDKARKAGKKKKPRDSRSKKNLIAVLAPRG